MKDTKKCAPAARGDKADGMSQPRWSLTRPTPSRVAAFLNAQREAPFSYPVVHRGASRGGAPNGFELDHNRVQLGTGAADFAAAGAALRAWTMFPAPWTRIVPEHAPISAGTTVAMLARAYGIWWMNACRIVYVVDEVAPLRRYGFAYGTLHAHVEEGEELFCIEEQPDGSVWYELRAFSRPRFWPVRLAKPLARDLQRRFARESKTAMQRAVAVARG
jgi:uncharacterized protein (UPF0548 family)